MICRLAHELCARCAETAVFSDATRTPKSTNQGVVLIPAQTLLLFGIIRGVILRHRDRELLCFEWVRGARVRILSVNDAERRFLPLEFGDE